MKSFLKNDNMKKLFFLIGVITLSGANLFAQCEKKVTWTASKGEFLDEAGNLQDTKDVKVFIQTSKQEIILIHSDDESDTLKGKIREITCDWKEPFKNGKITLKADLTERSGDYANSVITIEAKDSHITILLHIEQPDGRKMQIRIPIDSYKEEG
jgi:hypothetical protein